ncbi:Mrp/NBP35 family ATP-binding protein [Telmatocola sphagniphila]|uniref:Iron-sulfur cluster carrier protein n=1 Tax=Telmatocola sphagniphila TaxID=1123043 RepID=A0A8E6B911_9BACT|nr:Mrp/NBP35 family ATP-binding protein [Telmatocola sphagniphila]QVL33602.1 Mrp/NBP35 family ATP-binding protein [Telmatocola sphagniphila]
MQPQTQAANPALADVKNILAVASGKGGVGKSTVSSNLALALKKIGQSVGLMDADIYGPSVPLMMGLGSADPQTAQFPLEKYGLKLMSMGFIPDATKGVLLRGPMVAKYVGAFLTQIPWGALDTLVIDMPPGTGDAQLTLCQTANVRGAIIVTTPQDVSLIDAVKALNMFRQLKVPVLGIIENMSYFVGDDGKRYEIFRHGGGKKLAEETGVEFLGEVPIDPRVAECGDAGEPLVHKYPDSPVAKAYLELAEKVLKAAAKLSETSELPAVQL